MSLRSLGQSKFERTEVVTEEVMDAVASPSNEDALLLDFLGFLEE